MKMFPQEIADGIRFTDRLTIASKIDLAGDSAAALPRSVATNKGQIDLHYLTALMVSNGMNGNDDFFATDQLWAARKSPADKPFNLEHDQSQIIGHLTDQYCAGDDRKPIPDDTAVADLPDKIHIICSAVIYKKWGDKEKQKEINRIIADIANGDWFVSMECLFKDFDYAVFDSTTAKIVQRTEATAHMTKALRAYGGKGVLDSGERIGRVIKILAFSGLGLVRQPANPASVIINTTKAHFSPIQLREAIASRINKDTKPMSQHKQDGDIEGRMLAFFNKNRPNPAALRKPADETEPSVLAHPKSGGLPSQDVADRLAQRQPDVEQPRGTYRRAVSDKPPKELARIASMLKHRGACPDEIKRREELRRAAEVQRQRDQRLGLN